MKIPVNQEGLSIFVVDRQIGNSKMYDSFQLFCVPLKDARRTLGITAPLPFYGVDIWNAYELSWLDKIGKTLCCRRRDLVSLYK